MAETEALERSLSGTVAGAVRELGEEWVLAVEVIDAILRRHSGQPGPSVRPEVISAMKALLDAEPEEAPARLPAQR